MAAEDLERSPLSIWRRVAYRLNMTDNTDAAKASSSSGSSGSSGIGKEVGQYQAEESRSRLTYGEYNFVLGNFLEHRTNTQVCYIT